MRWFRKGKWKASSNLAFDLIEAYWGGRQENSPGSGRGAFIPNLILKKKKLSG